WIRANHDVWRVRQMLALMAAKTEAERQLLWSRPAAGAAGALGEETSLAFYFGDFSQYRFEAIQWSYDHLWTIMHDLTVDGSPLDLEYNPPAPGDICNTTTKVLAHHAVISNIKICSEFWDKDEGYRSLVLVHEPLHHTFVPWNESGPRVDPIQDRHLHAHGDSCLADVQSDKAYGIDKLRHLATYVADDGGSCSHRNLAFRNNDSYAWAATVIGSHVRFGSS